MNDEIKEILDCFKRHIEQNESMCCLSMIDVPVLLDYITNLQKENEEFKLELSGYRSAILKNDNLLGLQQKIERLNNGIERINSIYRSMQFSAPENQYIFINQLGEVLKELKGSDKDENKKR